MTLAETLERLAVVAPEWLSFDNKTNSFTIKDGNGWFIHPEEILKVDEYVLFGACCEKVKAEGWSITSTQFGEDRGQIHEYYVVILGQDTRHSAYSDDSLARAAASALLAALEGRVEKCEHCINGVQSDPIKGTDLAVNTHCPACKGSGKKQEVKA